MGVAIRGPQPHDRVEDPVRDDIEEAQESKRLRSIPIIFLPAYTDNETNRQSVMTESNSYLVKPIKPPELCANIEIPPGSARPKP